MYALLQKGRFLVQSGRLPQHIDAPAAENLLTFPDRYRGWPIRLAVMVARVEKLEAPADISPPPSWRGDRKIWKLACYTAQTPQMPLLAFTAIEPASVAQNLDDTRKPPRLQHCEINGYFYKVHRGEDVSGRQRDFPVILAWNVEPITSSMGQPVPPQFAWVLILVLLMGVFLFAKVLARKATPSPAASWRERAFEHDSSQNKGKEEVNPALVAAVRQSLNEEEPNEVPHGQG